MEVLEHCVSGLICSPLLGSPLPEPRVQAHLDTDGTQRTSKFQSKAYGWKKSGNTAQHYVFAKHINGDAVIVLKMYDGRNEYHDV